MDQMCFHSLSVKPYWPLRQSLCGHLPQRLDCGHLPQGLSCGHFPQGWLVEVNCVISDRRIPLLTGIPLCMSLELSRRGYSMIKLCSIRHDIPVPLHTPGAYDQCWVFDHRGDKQWVVLRTRYGTWWPRYGQFEVRWLQPLQLWLSAGISLVAPMLVSLGRDLCHVQPHPTWFEPTAKCRS